MFSKTVQTEPGDWYTSYILSLFLQEISSSSSSLSKSITHLLKGLKRKCFGIFQKRVQPILTTQPGNHPLYLPLHPPTTKISRLEPLCIHHKVCEWLSIKVIAHGMNSQLRQWCHHPSSHQPVDDEDQLQEQRYEIYTTTKDPSHGIHLLLHTTPVVYYYCPALYLGQPGGSAG